MYQAKVKVLTPTQLIVGFTSRRKNVPGQVKSSNITSMNAIKQILSRLVIRTDDGVYISHKKLCFVKSVMVENRA